MKRIFLIVLSLGISGCMATPSFDFDSLTDLQPRVVSVAPDDGSVVDGDSRIEVLFSHPLESASVSETTLAVVKFTGDGERDDLIEDAVDGDEPGIEGRYEFSEGDTRVAFSPGESLEEGATYFVIATPSILGADLLPLNQLPGALPTPFVSEFRVLGGGESVGDLPGGSTAVDNAPVERIRPAYLIINELLYDVVGSDTDGDVFVELYGEAGGDITGYELVFVNGADGVIKDTIELPDDAIIPEDGVFVIADARTGSPGVSDVEGADYVINFDPQNGPDCVQLLGGEGELIDALGYGQPILDPAENGMTCFETTPADDVPSGQSLERVDTFDTDLNSGDFMPNDIPTPGVIGGLQPL